MKKMTDKEILELTTVEFIGRDNEEVRVLLDDITVTGFDTVEINGVTSKLNRENIDKIILNKGKLSLAKADIDANAIGEYIKNSIDTGIEKEINSIATAVFELTRELRDSITNINKVTTDIGTTIDSQFQSVNDIEAKYSSTRNSVESIVKELKVLIED